MTIMTAMVLLACVPNRNLTPQENEEYHKAKMRYEWGQKPGI
jgi:hypothetical protein